MNRRQALSALSGALVAGSFPRQGSAAPRIRSTAEFTPFAIDFPRALLDDLRGRVERFRWPDQGFEEGWATGTDERALRDLVDYWLNDYEWYRIQERLNGFSHFRGEVEGDALHLVRVGPGRRSIPLLLLHGWPSSFLEFLPSASILGESASGAGFELIIPSLPGFALSDPPSRPGVGADGIAQRLHRMMLELGFTRYGVHGGDWGAIIGTQLARRYPEAIAGLHLNFVASAPPPPNGEPPSSEEVEYRERRERFQRDETGYSSIQGTRPRTLSYAQTDSPVGLLAWIVEKYWAWGDHRGDLMSVFDRDTLITTAMLYWLPNRVFSAARIYYETRTEGLQGGFVEVPTAYADFPQEPWGPPPEVVARSYNLVRVRSFPRGGHFPALEQTGRWAADVAEFFTGIG